MSRENGSTIPNYLSAGTPEGLRRLMRLNNAKRGCWHKYDIMFVNGRWFAWYQEAVRTAQEQAGFVKEVTDDLAGGKP